jgi:hypothetical protein
MNWIQGYERQQMVIPALRGTFFRFLSHDEACWLTSYGRRPFVSELLSHATPKEYGMSGVLTKDRVVQSAIKFTCCGQNPAKTDLDVVTQSNDDLINLPSHPTRRSQDK